MKVKYIILIFLNIGFFSCKKFIAVDPPKDQIVSSAVYSNNATAIAVLRGIYSKMINGTGFASGGSSSITLLAGLSSDELMNYSSSAGVIAFYRNSLAASTFTSNLWSEPYQYISNANAAIEGLTSSVGVTQATKSELIGEAKFIRAFCYFYLVNLFGDVPLILTTDFTQNALASRTPKALVYKQIIADLIDAQNTLANDFSFSSGERDQPNKWAATALLARVYLYTGDWSNAETQATAVINNPTYGLDSDLNLVFLSNSSEAIWQLKPLAVAGAANTNEGPLFIPVSTPSWATISSQLLSSFEMGDVRKTKWINSLTVGSTTYYYPFKYKIRAGTTLTEYSMVLRLAEQYLIRAEARAQVGNTIGAVADLNVIRLRAGLTAYGGLTTQAPLLAAILHEGQVELFAEWGHRWFDLKRTGIVDAVMTGVTPQKGGSWSTSWQWYPLPQSEILNDNNLTQNSNY